MTCEPAAIVGATGATAGLVPWSITSGLYTMSWPFGDRMVASMNTPSEPPLAQVQPSPSSHGVARPAAVSGLAGTDTVQLVEFAASAVVWVKLTAAPAASTAFDPAAPARPGGLMGGMPIARVVVAGAEAEADAAGQGAAEAEAEALPLAAVAGAGALALAAPPRLERVHWRLPRPRPGLAAALALADAQVPSRGLRNRGSTAARDRDDDPESRGQCYRNGERYRVP